MKLVLDLPLPPSANVMWRNHHRAARLNAWETECFQIMMASARFGWRGLFHKGDVFVRIDLDQQERAIRGDCDNRCKATLDFLQHVGVLTNDKQVRRVSIGWDETHGIPCRVSVAATPSALDGPAEIHVADPRRVAA